MNNAFANAFSDDDFPADPKSKQLRYISGFASLGFLSAILPYLPHALRAGATKEEIMTAYASSVPSGDLIHSLPALKRMSDSVDDLLIAGR